MVMKILLFSQEVLTNKYNLLEEWMHANKLVINPDKTHLMVMASKKKTISREGK